MRRWAILTGEYPPQPGGVSDYTRQVAAGLAAVGDEVHVFAPACDAPEPKNSGVAVHRLPGCFRPRDLGILRRELGALAPDCVLVQYVPDAFRMRSINLPFCLWLRFCCRWPVWMMFHEVAFPWVRGSIKLNVLAAINRIMAALLVGASERIFISIPAWRPMLERWYGAERPITWSPVPSNVPTRVEAVEVAMVRKKLGDAEDLIVGHFGSYYGHAAPMLRKLLPEVLRGTRRIALLLGRGGAGFREKVLADHPELGGRIIAPGELPGEAVAAHLAACDVLLQPYIDGISARRSSAMAGLALGVPVVTNAGPHSEPLWNDSTVALAGAEGDQLLRMVQLTEALLADPERRAALGARARAFYADHFGIEQTIARLHSPPSAVGSALADAASPSDQTASAKTDPAGDAQSA